MLQLVYPVGDDQVAGRKTLADGYHVALGCAHGHAAHLDGLVRLDDIYERTLLAALETSRRDHDRIAQSIDEQLGVDELIWKQRVVLVGKGRLELDRAGGLIDLVVGREQGSGREFVLEVMIVSRDRQLAVGLHRGLEAWQIVLRNTEINRDRLQLRDHRETGRVGRMNDIARVHQPEPNPARDRRSDAAINQLKLGVFERRHIFRERALGLGELHLIRTRIDLSQQIAGLYQLSLGKIYLIERAIHPAFDGDGVVGRDRSDRGYVLVHIAELGRHRCYRNDRV